MQQTAQDPMHGEWDNGSNEAVVVNLLKLFVAAKYITADNLCCLLVCILPSSGPRTLKFYINDPTSLLDWASH